MEGLTIGQAAKRANVHIETIRYYERRGMIPEPPRTESGYRTFPQDVVNEITFIKRTQALGFTLEEIKKLLAASRDETFRSEEMHDFATRKRKEIEAKMQDLQQMKTVLEDLAETCPGSGISKRECPILKHFEGGN